MVLGGCLFFNILRPRKALSAKDRGLLVKDLVWVFESVPGQSVGEATYVLSQGKIFLIRSQMIIGMYIL